MQLAPLLLLGGCSGLATTTSRLRATARLDSHGARVTMAMPPPLRSAAVVLGAANLVQYHVELTRSEAAGQPSWRSAQAAARASWARFVRETSGWLYAIQTLRNAITASTFLASTVLTLFTVTMGYLSNAMAKSFEWLVLLRFSTTGFLMLCSAYSFLQRAARLTRPPVSAQPASGRRLLRAECGRGCQRHLAPLGGRAAREPLLGRPQARRGLPPPARPLGA